MRSTSSMTPWLWLWIVSQSMYCAWREHRLDNDRGVVVRAEVALTSVDARELCEHVRDDGEDASAGKCDVVAGREDVDVGACYSLRNALSRRGPEIACRRVRV